MKEMFVAFVIALVVGSVWNGMKADQGINGGEGGGGIQGLNIADGSGQQPEQNPLQITAHAQAGQELVLDVDEGSFQGYVLDSREPVLVEFYTDNCPHCKTMAPVLGQLAYNGQGIVRVCKINGSKNPGLAERYDISGVPAFILFTNGHMMDTTSGARSFEGMRQWLGQNNVQVPARIGMNGSKTTI